MAKKKEVVSKTPDGNSLYIENLPEVLKKAEEELQLKKNNPGVILDGESGVNYIDGLPHLVIDNKYFPYDEAKIILQTRKVVREYLKLQNLKQGKKDFEEII